MIKDVEGKPYEEKLKKVSMFSLWKRQLRGDMMVIFKYLNGCHKKRITSFLYLRIE